MNHGVVGLDHAAMDLGDPAAIEKCVGGADFDLLLTPAALTNVDYCEQHPDEAMAVNADAPAQMAQIAKSKSARMIHFSTDYVFDGKDPSPRTEQDAPNPLGAYGRSKATGDANVLAVSADFLVARVSWIFGPERPSFLDSIIQRAIKDDQVEAIADKFSTPSYSRDIARMIGAIVERPEIDGVLNVCNRGECSWRDYGQVGIDAAVAAGLPVKATELGAMSLADMEFQAPRPQHTAMSCLRFEELTGIQPRPWQEAVTDYVTAFAGQI